MAGGGIGL